MKERELAKLSKEMTAQQRIAACLQLWAADKVEEGRRVLREAPPEQQQHIDYLWRMMRQASRVSVFAGQPRMRAVIDALRHLVTIRMAGLVGLQARIALDNLGFESDSEFDLNALANDSGQDTLLAQTAREVWAFQRGAGLVAEELKGFADVQGNPGAQEGDECGLAETISLWLKRMLEEAAAAYRTLRAVQIALHSLAAGLGVPSLEGAVLPGFEQEMKDNLADLRRMLEGMLAEDQLAALEPSDEEVRELLTPAA